MFNEHSAYLSVCRCFLLPVSVHWHIKTVAVAVCSSTWNITLISLLNFNFNLCEALHLHIEWNPLKLVKRFNIININVHLILFYLNTYTYRHWFTHTHWNIWKCILNLLASIKFKNPFCFFFFLGKWEISSWCYGESGSCAAWTPANKSIANDG